MASRAELEAALRAAHEAGDTDNATRLASALSEAPDAPKSSFDDLPWFMKRTQSVAAPIIDYLKDTPGDRIKKLGGAADDTARIVGNGFTLGLADRLAGKMNGTGYDAEKQLSDEAATRAGSAGTAADLLSSFAPASGISKGFGALTKLKRATTGETAVREGLTGATMAGTESAVKGDDPNEVAANAGLGLGLGSGGGILSSKAGDIVNSVASKLGAKPGVLVDDVVAPKTVPQLRTDKNAAYDAVDNLGVGYDSTDFGNMIRKTMGDLSSEGINPNLHPKATEFVNTMVASHPPGTPISPRSIDQLRQQLNRDVTGSRGEKHMAGIVRDNIDEFIANGRTTKSSTATAADADAALTKARDTNRRMRTLEDVDGALYKGENAASDRGDVNNLRSLLNKRDFRSGMSPDEIAAMERVVRGGGVENFLRKSVGGIPITPLGAGVVVGSATANPLAGLLAGGTMAVGQPLVNKAAQGYTDRSIQELKNAIAGGRSNPSAIRPFLSSATTDALAAEIENDRKRKRR